MYRPLRLVTWLTDCFAVCLAVCLASLLSATAGRAQDFLPAPVVEDGRDWIWVSVDHLHAGGELDRSKMLRTFTPYGVASTTQDLQTGAHLGLAPSELRSRLIQDPASLCERFWVTHAHTQFDVPTPENLIRSEFVAVGTVARSTLGFFRGFAGTLYTLEDVTVLAGTGPESGLPLRLFMGTGTVRHGDGVACRKLTGFPRSPRQGDRLAVFTPRPPTPERPVLDPIAEQIVFQGPADDDPIEVNDAAGASDRWREYGDLDALLRALLARR